MSDSEDEGWEALVGLTAGEFDAVDAVQNPSGSTEGSSGSLVWPRFSTPGSDDGGEMGDGDSGDGGSGGSGGTNTATAINSLCYTVAALQSAATPHELVQLAGSLRQLSRAVSSHVVAVGALHGNNQDGSCSGKTAVLPVLLSPDGAREATDAGILHVLVGILRRMAQSDVDDCSGGGGDDDDAALVGGEGGSGEAVVAMLHVQRQEAAGAEAKEQVLALATELMTAVTPPKGEEFITLELPVEPATVSTAAPLPLKLVFATPSFSLADVGYKLWPSSHVLCRRICTPEAEGPGQGPGQLLVAGRRVVEIGCGVGSAGLVAARCGAAAVTLTDFNAEVLRVAALNAARNGLTVVEEVSSAAEEEAKAARGREEGARRVEVRHLDWTQLSSLPRCLRNAADVVIGADVVYEPAHAALIPHVLAALLRPGGRALLVLQRDHEGFRPFEALLEGSGCMMGDGRVVRLRRPALPVVVSQRCDGGAAGAAASGQHRGAGTGIGMKTDTTVNVAVQVFELELVTMSCDLDNL